MRSFNLSERLNEAIDGFIAAKHNLEDDEPTTESYLSVLSMTVMVRQCLLGEVESLKVVNYRLQEIWLSDIATEGYAFTLASQIIMRVAKEDLGWGKLKFGDRNWLYGLTTLIHLVRHVRYSAFQEKECQAIENMLELIVQHAWSGSDGFRTKGFASMGYSLGESKVLLKSILDRTLRLTESYMETVTELFPPVVRKVGRTLGVPPHAIAVFAEGDIRANIVFQVRLARRCIVF